MPRESLQANGPCPLSPFLPRLSHDGSCLRGTIRRRRKSPLDGIAHLSLCYRAGRGEDLAVEPCRELLELRLDLGVAQVLGDGNRPERPVPAQNHRFLDVVGAGHPLLYQFHCLVDVDGQQVHQGDLVGRRYFRDVCPPGGPVVETPPCLLAQLLLLHHLPQGCGLSIFWRKRLRKILQRVPRNVNADEVEELVGAHWHPLTFGEAVDFWRGGDSFLKDQVEEQGLGRIDPVGNECRTVLEEPDGRPADPFAHLRGRLNNGGVGAFTWDYLDQLHRRRRVEEVHADDPLWANRRFRQL